MTFSNEAKTLISLFIKETRESIIWFAAELKRQYHLSILKEIASTYPETQLHIDKTCDIVDGLPEDCPDFVEASDKFERTNIDSKNNFNFENEEEADVEAFKVKIEQLSAARNTLLSEKPEDLPEGFTRDPETGKIHPF